jgi:signal transduction histidine kinase
MSYFPITHNFAGFAAFSLALLAFGRYPVLREAAAYWTGLGFAALGVQSVFFMLTWPGLLPGAQASIAQLSNTSIWIALFELLTLSLTLLAAVLSRWPGWSQGDKPGGRPLPGRRWLWPAAAWIGLVAFICVLIIAYGQYLPQFVGLQEDLTPLILSLDWVFILLFSTGALAAARRRRKTGEALFGYLALTQLALAFGVLAAVIGARRIDLWFIFSRIVIVGGFLSLMYGLLSDYVRLFWREREGRLTLEAILENVPTGLAITGGPPDFPIVRVSRRGLEMNRGPVEELVELPAGQHAAAWNIFLQDGVTQPQPEQMPLYLASRFGEETQNLEMVMEGKDGRKVPVLVSAAPIRDASGQIVAAINTWQDISEIKAAEAELRYSSKALKMHAAELERANRDLRSFTVMAAHDLQEPLRKIEAFGDAVLEKAGNLDQRQADRVQRMRKSAQQMRDMVNGLLQLAFLATDTQPFQPVDLRLVAEEILGVLEGKIQQSGGRVEIGALPALQADPHQMRMLFLHLVENALKFQPPGVEPKVNIDCAQPAPGWVEIRIKDNGIGFDEAHAGHLFEPFERLVGRNQAEYVGSGIGLAICLRIVERHGGEITAFSKPGEGSTFTVRLPTRQDTIPVK